MSLRLRLALAAEQRTLEDLQRRASLMWEEDRDALLAHPDAIEIPLEQITDGRTIVAEQDGGIAGFAVVLKRADGEADLDGLFVEPPLWRKGIGRALVEEAAAMAIADGASGLFVIANSRALDFYRACAFAPIGQVPTRFRPALLMRRALTGRPPG